MHFNKPFVLILFLFICASELFGQNSDKVEFFEQTYGKSYLEASNSISKTIKIEFAQKVLSDTASISNESFKAHSLQKAIKLVDPYSEGYAIAIQLYDELLKIKSEKLLIKTIEPYCNLIELYIKSLPSSQIEKRTELTETKLKYEILYAKILFKKNNFNATYESLKDAIQSAKTLKYDKTVDLSEQACKSLTPFLQSERTIQKHKENIKSNVEFKNSIDQVGELLLKDVGDLDNATPFLIRNSQLIVSEFAIQYRKFLANNKKASLPPLYLTETDLDLSNEDLFSLLEAEPTLATQVKELKESYQTGNKKSVVGLIKLAEGQIDKGNTVVFTEHVALADNLLAWADKTTSINAKVNLLKIANEVLYPAIRDNKSLTEIQSTQIKIKTKNMGDKIEALIKEKTYISIEAIPTSIIKPDLKELQAKRFITTGLVLENAETCFGKNITNYLKIETFAPLFQIAIENNLEAKAFNNSLLWKAISINPTNNFSIAKDKSKVTIFHSYLHSQTPQKIIFKISSFGRTFLYIDGKPIKLTEKDSKLSGEYLLANKESQLRIVVFNGETEDPNSNFSIAILNSKEEAETGILTSITSYHQ